VQAALPPLPVWKGGVHADPRDKLGLKGFHLRLVPHALSIRKKSKGMSYWKLIRTALMEQTASRFQRTITGSEAEFFFDYPLDLIWTALHDELSQRTEQKTDTEKCLVSLLWSVDGIYSLLDVPKGTTCSITSFTDAVIPNLIENVWFPTGRKILKC
jgi:hypothetical protein